MNRYNCMRLCSNTNSVVSSVGTYNVHCTWSGPAERTSEAWAVGTTTRARPASYVKPRARSTGHATRQGYTIVTNLSRVTLSRAQTSSTGMYSVDLSTSKPGPRPHSAQIERR